MNEKNETTISCPKGTYAVCYKDLVVTCILIDSFEVETAIGLIDSINRVLARSSDDRNADWRYCISVSKNTASSPGAESKFKEFLRFRKWLCSLNNIRCKVALTFEKDVGSISRHQIQRIFDSSEVRYELFPSIEEALPWLEE